MILVKPGFEILTKLDVPRILENIERAGRTCYKSEDKITTGSAKKFITTIIKSGHHSVLEHESISVRVICDRGVTHEIVRHRLVAYSQESTRYCNYEGGVTFVVPPWVDIEPGKYTDIQDGGYGSNISSIIWAQAVLQSEMDYIHLLERGWSPQQARSVLPNSLKTEIVMTTNIREWRHILKLRTSSAAHPQMREIMVPLLIELNKLMPVLFDNL